MKFRKVSTKLVVYINGLWPFLIEYGSSHCALPKVQTKEEQSHVWHLDLYMTLSTFFFSQTETLKWSALNDLFL